MLTAPSISKDLITYLEKVFPSTIPTSPLNASPHEVAAAVHFISGRGAVIDHLTAVYEEQHNEDPLNVYESTEAP